MSLARANELPPALQQFAGALDRLDERGGGLSAATIREMFRTIYILGQQKATLEHEARCLASEKKQLQEVITLPQPDYVNRWKELSEKISAKLKTVKGLVTEQQKKFQSGLLSYDDYCKQNLLLILRNCSKEEGA